MVVIHALQEWLLGRQKKKRKEKKVSTWHWVQIIFLTHVWCLLDMIQIMLVLAISLSMANSESLQVKLLFQKLNPILLRHESGVLQASLWRENLNLNRIDKPYNQYDLVQSRWLQRSNLLLSWHKKLITSKMTWGVIISSVFIVVTNINLLNTKLHLWERSSRIKRTSWWSK